MDINDFITGKPLLILMGVSMGITMAVNGFINTLRPRQNGRHFPDNIFKYIFVNENAWILPKISLKFVPKVPIDNNPALV